MQALDLLLNRTSQPRLQKPAPNEQELQNIIHAAMRVPDHASLTPWKFVVCQEAGLTRLGNVFEQAALDEQLSEKEVLRAPQLPLRAPMVIAVIAQIQEHEKVPWVEQVASASCAAYAMQLAAKAQGYDNVWRTGIYAQSKVVKDAFGLKEQDEIVGFLYVGTSNADPISRPSKSSFDFTEHWN
ncbi:MAG: NAD(P)H nitroreductase [Paraglaciecola sp.]|uniref:NAD(P)H nitroreductase n=1 Tax=Paraglaciecola sp. TaxID=1920173 RepID=UPI00273F2760|nr:NAD(P)H nitroreductase [Paraglaciecola sp.]MDP5030560.1 NAD(P)H nitroreductase [Paraglaciecola sp.]MDP5133868.1 NAD(P)H nitroreductase [Paraglaciecola sp.]